MKNVVSFCLWGTNVHYHQGAESALASTLTLYPGWEPWFYLAEDVPPPVAKRLAAGGAHVIHQTRGQDRPPAKSTTTYQFEPAFWRFLPASDTSVAKLLVRDSDSPVTPREVAAVDEWLESGADFHIMRDHPKHEYPILGGMWGASAELLRDIDQLIRSWKRFDFYGCDQKFLSRVIYPRVRSNAFIHSECIMFPEEKIHPFPTSRTGEDFIGISHTGDESRLALQLKYLKDWVDNECPVYSRHLPWSIKGLIRTYSHGRIMRGKTLPAVIR